MTEQEIKCKACPECGCVEYVNQNLVGEGSRDCKECGQEWWADIDYTGVKQEKAFDEWFFSRDIYLSKVKDLVRKDDTYKSELQTWKAAQKPLLEENEKLKAEIADADKIINSMLLGGCSNPTTRLSRHREKYPRDGLFEKKGILR